MSAVKTNPLFSAHCALVSPDSMSAAAHYVDREYGSYGYRIGVSTEIAARRVTVFEVGHFDGSRFNIVADDWGNVARIPDSCSRDQAAAFVCDMSRKASES